MRLVLRGGQVAASPDQEPVRADLAVVRGLIAEVGHVAPSGDDQVLDCAGRTVIPGLIDAHSHADGTIFDEDVQLANLRQGVTTVVTGQDGVGFAPGSGAYATGYFGALNGRHPSYAGGGVAELLASYDGAVRLNVGYVVPAGTVRHEVLGLEPSRPTAAETARMAALVDEGMEQGALGLSTGLDYTPGVFADAEELAALCRPVAAHDGVHQSHMRGGYDEASDVGVAELRRIARESGVRTHIAHFVADAAVVAGLIDAANSDAEFTFDAYPYRRSFTLLGMSLLPPDLLARGNAAVVALLADPRLRAELVASQGPLVASRPDNGQRWAEHATLAHVGAPEFAWAAGLTVAAAAGRAGRDPLNFAYQLLAASDLAVTAMFAVPKQRSEDELARIFSHPRHIGGSDGIHVGAHPHPRAWGTFARLLGRYVRERRDWTLPQAVAHLSTNPARILRLGKRGLIRPGWVADLAVVDLDAVADRADYGTPRALAVGVDDVIVRGHPVLARGRLTAARAGGGLRRQPVVGGADGEGASEQSSPAGQAVPRRRGGAGT